VWTSSPKRATYESVHCGLSSEYQQTYVVKPKVDWTYDVKVVMVPTRIAWFYEHKRSSVNANKGRGVWSVPNDDLDDVIRTRLFLMCCENTCVCIWSRLYSKRRRMCVLGRSPVARCHPDLACCFIAAVATTHNNNAHHIHYYITTLLEASYKLPFYFWKKVFQRTTIQTSVYLRHDGCPYSITTVWTYTSTILPYGSSTFQGPT
jgi:hypothetical protein